jgi:hypothetical protein
VGGLRHFCRPADFPLFDPSGLRLEVCCVTYRSDFWRPRRREATSDAHHSVNRFENAWSVHAPLALKVEPRPVYRDDRSRQYPYGGKTQRCFVQAFWTSIGLVRPSASDSDARESEHAAPPVGAG